MGPEQQFFSVGDAAKYIGLTESALRSRVKKGEVDVQHVGYRVFIERSVLDNLMRSKLSRK
jgi:hypothetical protein